MIAVRAVLATAAAAVVVAGCSAPSTGTPPVPTPAPVAQAAPTTPPTPRLVIATTIAGGGVTPTNAELEATVGEPIELRVDSDVADQLHIHSNPEHTFAVEARRGQSFEFRVDVPGRVAVELHELDRTIATIQVR